MLAPRLLLQQTLAMRSCEVMHRVRVVIVATLQRMAAGDSISWVQIQVLLIHVH